MAVALFGYSIETGLPLLCARSGTGERGRLRVEPAQGDLLEREGELISWAQDPGGWFALARVAGGLVASCSLTGDYLLDPERGVVEVAIRGPFALWEHRFGSTIVPLLLAERDDLSLHAASVLVGRRAVLLCGPPGRGKSTLAAAMARHGHPVASEDGTVISDVESDPWVWPGQFGVRVTGSAMRALGREPRSDEPEGKFRRLIEARGEAALPPAVPAAVVLLRERGGRALEVQRLDPVAALPAVAPHAFYGGPERLQITLDRVARLVERVPAWAVRLPDELSRLGECALTILDTVLPGRLAGEGQQMMLDTRWVR